jgi:hypothetical protein
MSWKQLQVALGTGYTDAASFRKAIKPALLKIQTIYPDLIIGERDGDIDVCYAQHFCHGILLL